MSKTMEFDVLIIGAGIAGLATALKLSEAGKTVAVVASGKSTEETNSHLAQGGIIYSKNSPDDRELLVKDICEASAGTSDEMAAKIIAENSGAILEEILIDKAKTNFAQDKNGKLLFTQEAAHSIARIIYQGDYTGKEIQRSLAKLLIGNPKYENIHWLFEHTAIDLITPGHHGVKIQQRYSAVEVVGAYVFNQKTEDVIKIMAKQTVLATGGYGGLYLHSSNGEWSRGDGHAMAKRAGAHMANMEFVQFHPTTFYTGNQQRHFLISEAIRGEGGKLINSKGEEFMAKYHPDKELAPRDVVARAIWDEMIINKSDYVFLDISHRSKEWIEERFPTIYSHCQSHNIDISKTAIPVVPAAHYTCGGVLTSVKGETSLKNLYAVGEVACTGLHGANRLASTSLLEGLTFGYLTAEFMIEKLPELKQYPADEIKDWENGTHSADLGLIAQDMMAIKNTMWNYLGLKRSNNRISRARAMFGELTEEIHKFYRHARLHDSLIGLRNAVEVAGLVLLASERNKQSIGCFYRENKIP